MEFQLVFLKMVANKYGWSRVTRVTSQGSKSIYKAMYTQSQKKRTMNSLTSLVTQGQGQVPPAGLYLIMII